jgi:hypothetical protein
MEDFFGVKCWAIDRFGTHPPMDVTQPTEGETSSESANETRFGFFANLLCEGAGAMGYDHQRDLLLDIYSHMFGGPKNGDISASLIEEGELVDPPMVSYGFPIAMDHQALGQDDAPSTEICPLEQLMGSELEQINLDKASSRLNNHRA